MIRRRNLLIEWKRHFEVESSHLNPSRNPLVGRKAVDFTFKIFSNCFGIDAFEIEDYELVQGQNALKEENFVFLLLAGKQIVGFLKLFSIAILIQIAEESDPELFANIKSLLKNRNFRDYLFESYSRVLLVYNQIKVENAEKNGIRLDVFSPDFYGRPALIECKKMYSLIGERFEHLHYLKRAFFTRWLKFQSDITAFFFSPRNSQTALPIEKELIVEGIRAYFRLEKSGELIEYPFRVFSDNNELLLQIERNRPGLIESLIDILPKPFYYIWSARPGILLLSDPTIFMFKHGLHYLVDKSEVLARLKTAIDHKRRQHKSYSGLKIIMLENEVGNNFEPSLIDFEMYSPLELNEYLETKKDDVIVCVVNKNYIGKIAPKVTLFVYSSKRLSFIADKIKTWSTDFIEKIYMNHFQ